MRVFVSAMKSILPRQHRRIRSNPFFGHRRVTGVQFNQYGVAPQAFCHQSSRASAAEGIQYRAAFRATSKDARFD
jgi:hypothetical protein